MPSPPTLECRAHYRREATPEAVNTAIRRYMQPGTLSRAYAGDFAGAAAQGGATGQAAGTPASTATGSTPGGNEAGDTPPARL